MMFKRIQRQAKLINRNFPSFLIKAIDFSEKACIIIEHLKIRYRGVEQLVARRAHNPEVAGSSPASATKNTSHPFGWLVFFIFGGLEGRAEQSNAPVERCDRERPSARRRASQVLSPQPKMQAIRQGGLCFLFLNLFVYGYNFLPVCLSILRHGFRRATSFAKGG